MDKSRIGFKIDEFLIDKYDLFLVDLWGTVHDGRKLYDGIIDTLAEIKNNGKKILLYHLRPFLNDIYSK